MKYIVVEKNLLECPVLIPPFWKHTDLLQLVSLTKIVSAGYVSRDEKTGRLNCYGGSESLKIPCRPVEDLDLILRCLHFEL